MILLVLAADILPRGVFERMKKLTAKYAKPSFAIASEGKKNAKCAKTAHNNLCPGDLCVISLRPLRLKKTYTGPLFNFRINIR